MDTTDTSNENTQPTIEVKSTRYIIPPHWAHFVAGGTGGSVAALVTCPLEVVKTRLQAAQHRPTTLPTNNFFGSRIANIFVTIWETEGIRGLWRGLGPNLAGVAPSRAIHFSTYNSVKRFQVKTMGFEESASVHLASAITAGMTVHTVTSPLWLVKTRLQLQGASVSQSSNLIQHAKETHYKNSIDCIRKVYREEGIRGFYKGLVASYVGISETAIQFVLYEKFKHMLQEEKFYSVHRYRPTSRKEVSEIPLSSLEYLTMASTAKLVASAATYPHEVVRTRMREQRGVAADRPNKYTGFVQCLRVIAAEEGMRGLYGGLTVHLLRVVPNAAIMFLTYETIIQMLTVE